jgi:outer membrane lipoprotein-sorting protein
VQHNPDPPRVYPDLLGAHSDPTLERLVTDLDTLYTTAEPPPAFTEMLRRRIDSRSVGHPTGAHDTKVTRPASATIPAAGVPGSMSALRFRSLRRRLVIALAAAAVLGAVAVTGMISLSGGAQPVSAGTILDRAVEAANPAAAGTRTYHRIGTSMSPGPEKAHSVTEETWYGGNGRARIELQAKDATGRTVEDSGFVIDGRRQTSFRTVDGKTYVTVTDLGADVGPAIDQKFSPGRNAGALSDVIAQYRGNGCSNVQQQADTRVANRAAYVIAVTPNTSGGGCYDANDASGRKPVLRTVIAVDKETFFPLRVQALNADGSVVRNWETTSIEYDIRMPDSTFTYTLPPGAIIQTEAQNTPGAHDKSPTKADQEKLEKIKMEEAQSRRAASVTPTPTPHP